MSLERPLVWIVTLVAAGVAVVGALRPPDPPGDLVLLVLALVVVVPLAFVFARLLLAVPDRARGWRTR